MTNEKYKIIKREDLPGGKIEFEIELPVETLKHFRADAVRDISNEIDIDGFRKGSAPESIIVQKVGELMVVEKSASRAIYNIIPIVITSEKIDALTFPEITITKLAPENPVIFKLSITSMPNISLPDYRTIAKKVPQEEVAEM
jgi:trigger factor